MRTEGDTDETTRPDEMDSAPKERPPTLVLRKRVLLRIRSQVRAGIQRLGLVQGNNNAVSDSRCCPP